MGYRSLPSFHPEPNELKESLRFIGTSSAHIAIAGSETHDLLLNYHQKHFSKGNRCPYVLWKAICLLSYRWF
jgi:hypothetical protein